MARPLASVVPTLQKAKGGAARFVSVILPAKGWASPQMTSLVARLSLIIAVSFLVAWASASSQVPPTPVEVRCDGDDGLTNRLREALENAFQSSSDFRLSSGEKPATLVVTIPTNVMWTKAKRADKRTKVVYKVEFASADDKAISESTGTCWDDALRKCADRIVKEARTAAYKTSVRKTP
jgi:hypothetical protein